MLTMPYDTESKSRNADFILIARKGDTTTLGAKGPVKLKNPPALRPVNPKNLHARRAIRHPLNPLNLLNPLNPRAKGASFLKSP